MDVTLKNLSETWWIEVCKKVKNAVVFIDGTMAECLHWHGGVNRLFDSGALACKEFSSFESVPETHRKAVFIVGSAVVATAKAILRDITTAHHFHYCVVITAASAGVHMFAEKHQGDNDMAAFHHLESEMLTWMRNKNYTVELFSFPLISVPITHTLFVMPPFKDMFPFSCGGSETANSEFSKLPSDLKVSVLHLASSLQSILSQLDMQEDIYSMGNLSTVIGNCLENHPLTPMRRKNASQRSTLILIDRHLDIASVSKFNLDNMLDRIRASLPPLPGHSCDVAVDMTPISISKQKQSISPGCLAHPDSTVPVFDWLLSGKQKDVLFNLQKEVFDTIPTRNTPQSFKKQISSTFSGQWDLIINKCGILQQSLAVVESLTSANNTKLEMVVSIERLLLQSIAADNNTTGALQQFVTLIKSRHERNLSIDLLLTILVHLYSLIGTDYEIYADTEMLVQTELAHAIYSDRNDLSDSVLNVIVEPDSNIESIEMFTRDIFSMLRRLSSSRNDLKRYKSLLRNEGPLQPLTHFGLIEQLILDLLDSRSTFIPDLVTTSSNLRSGFSLLKRPAKHPMDNRNIIFFVVGGLTGHETRLLTESMTAAGKNVFVGSTRLLSPFDTLKFLIQSSY
ncbi:sec1 family domain-containing protein 2-like [Nilaparvata lugens]|uniref:sec1 family domain-containing protein 2-like n=1 Tax=Nilaparvata lugens TaxID=108931 RepID=UPI00193E6914|nr:sec1 family domain-containing protein 2-like [Nilaparvata lugens]XP_039288783.1 sec1 family domain-containing protein 2-like [Nilaparvata lugens]